MYINETENAHEEDFFGSSYLRSTTPKRSSGWFYILILIIGQRGFKIIGGGFLSELSVGYDLSSLIPRKRLQNDACPSIQDKIGL